MDRTPLETIREAIERTTGPGRNHGNSWEYRCPAHHDSNPSLSVTENQKNHALVHCQAGCSTQDVLAAVGLRLRDLYPIEKNNRSADPVVARYRYTDEDGELLFEVERTASKRFRQRRPDPDKPGQWIYNLDRTRRTLYRLPLVLEAIRSGQTVYVCEGEKDADHVEATGRVATTNPGGVGKWRPEYTETLRGAHIVILRDKDPAPTAGKRGHQGQEHADQVYWALHPVAASIALMEPSVGKDITDQLTRGLDVDDASFVNPKPQTPTDTRTGGSEAVPGQGEPFSSTVESQPTSGAPTVQEQVGARIRLIPASEFKMRPVQWVWEERIPLGEICLIPGREGIGKSTFLAWMAAEITRGTLPGVYHGEPRGVLYAASEDAWDYTIAPRLHAAGADLSMVYRVDVVEEEGVPGKLILPTHCRLLPEAAEQVKAAILMCDPILSNIAEQLNPNHARELRKALEPLRDAAELAGIAVAGLAHFNKSQQVDAATAIAGSRAWMEVARAGIIIAREQRDRPDGGKAWVQVMTQNKNNLGRLDLPSLEYEIVNHTIPLDSGDEIRIGKVEWLGESDTTADEIIGRRPGQAPNTNRDRTTGVLIMEVLEEADRALNPTEIMRELETRGSQISYNTVKQRLHHLVKSGTITRLGMGLYKIPDDAPTRARTRVAPPSITVTRTLPKPTPPTPSYGGGEGGKDVTNGRDRQGSKVTVTEGGEGVDNLGRNLGAVGELGQCQVCFGPMEIIETGQVFHPGCTPPNQTITGDTIGDTRDDTTGGET